MNTSYQTVGAALANQPVAKALWVTVYANFSQGIVMQGYLNMHAPARRGPMTIEGNVKLATHIAEADQQAACRLIVDYFSDQRVTIERHDITEAVLKDGDRPQVSVQLYPGGAGGVGALYATLPRSLPPKIKKEESSAQYVLFVVAVNEDGYAIDTGFFALNDRLIAKNAVHLDKDVHNAMPVTMEESVILKQYILDINERASVTLVPKPAPRGDEAGPRFEEMRSMLAKMVNQTN